MKNLYISISLIVLCLSATAQETNEYKAETFIQGNDTLLYRILMPVNFNPEIEYPVVFVLHGSGERGNDNQAQLTHGSKLFLDSNIREKYPAIIIFPQCPANSYWSNVNIPTVNGKRTFLFQKGGKPTLPMKLLMGLVDKFEDQPYVDDDRLYVGGLSMGGMGTFEILRRMKGNFAAAFPICGGDNPKNVKKYKDVPLWIFHGAKDDVVPPENSQIIVDALKAKGADVKFSLYPEANHNSWDQAFAEPQLLPWLYSHRKD
jgi:predicted peptidase